EIRPARPIRGEGDRAARALLGTGPKDDAHVHDLAGKEAEERRIHLEAGGKRDHAHFGLAGPEVLDRGDALQARPDRYRTEIELRRLDDQLPPGRLGLLRLVASGTRGKDQDREGEEESAHRARHGPPSSSRYGQVSGGWRRV